MKMSGKTYDRLKFVVWLYVPLMTLATTLLQIWFPNSPYLEPIQQTLIAVNVFLGAIVSKSNYDYNKGELDDEDDEVDYDDYNE